MPGWVWLLLGLAGLGTCVAVGSARTQVNSKTSKYDILIARYLGDSGSLSLMATRQATNQIIPRMVGISSELVMGTIGSDQDLTTLATEFIRSRTKRPRLVGSR